MEHESFKGLLDSTFFAVFLLDDRGKIHYSNYLGQKFIEENGTEFAKQIMDQFASNKMDSNNWAKISSFKLAEVDIVGTARLVSILETDYILLSFLKLEQLEPLYDDLIVIKRELEEVFNNSFDEIFITDGDGTALRISTDACERLYGVKPEKLIGRNVRDLETEGYFFPSVYPEVIQRKKRVTVLQKNKMGQKTIVTANPILDEEGNVIRLICNSRDITELVNLREKLQKAESKMQDYYKELMLFKQGTPNIDSIIAESPNMLEIISLAKRISGYDTTVLLLGESGVGKDIVARFIHQFSRRADMPFIKINCGSIPENLLESELFGYESGAFTGARKEGKKGLIEEAEGGTLFLDEIADLPFHLQVKLLTFIEERRFTSVGALKPKIADIRIIAATNKDIGDMVQQGKFREDLFYRLNVISFTIPPLRDRPEDIKKLCHYFIERFNKQFSKNKRISPEAMEALLAYHWPGNVRQLENAIERFLVLTDENTLACHHLYGIPGLGEINGQGKRSHGNVELMNMPTTGEKQKNLQDIVEQAEERALKEAYNKYGNMKRVAEALQISYSTVVRKLKRYGLSD